LNEVHAGDKLVINYNVTKREDGDYIGLYVPESCIEDNKCSISHGDILKEVGSITLSFPNDAKVGSDFEMRYIRGNAATSKQKIKIRDNSGT
jgi:hypothetical protein